MASAPPTQGIQGQGPCITQPAVQPQAGAEQVVPPVNNQQNPAVDNANILGGMYYPICKCTQCHLVTIRKPL